MSRQVVDLTSSVLEQLGDPCGSCVFWEVAHARRGPDGSRGAQAKEAWVGATQLEWGAPGKAVLVDGELAGYGLLAPGALLPRTRRLRRRPSDDALLCAALWVAPDHRGEGLAKLLLHALLRETHKRGQRALEAYGVRQGVLPASCVLPEGFLLASGFEVLHDDAQLPLLRLDLRKTVRWQESMSHALEGVRSALGGRERVPAPARSVPHATTPAGPPA